MQAKERNQQEQHNFPQDSYKPRLIACEVTRRCNLACLHCRASAQSEPYPDELTSEEWMGLIDEVVSFSSPILILTGGEPTLRKDIYEIAHYATSKGLRVVLGSNGININKESARRMKEALALMAPVLRFMITSEELKEHLIRQSKGPKRPRKWVWTFRSIPPLPN